MRLLSVALVVVLGAGACHRPRAQREPDADARTPVTTEAASLAAPPTPAVDESAKPKTRLVSRIVDGQVVIDEVPVDAVPVGAGAGPVSELAVADVYNLSQDQLEASWRDRFAP